MEKSSLLENSRNDIIFKIKTITALLENKCKIEAQCIKEISNHGKIKTENLSEINQALNDAVLNSVASLIDYYCVYCMIDIGIAKENINKVQYKAINKRLLINSSKLIEKDKKPTATFQSLREQFDFILINNHKLNLSEINSNYYWNYFFYDAIYKILSEYGISIDEKQNSPSLDNKKLEIPKQIEQYHWYMDFLYCNEFQNSGIRYNIYLDLNNYLKHNSIPYVIQHTEDFKEPNQRIVYSFFRIDKEKSFFLKEGILKDVTNTDFFKMKENLEFKSINKYKSCEIEKSWGLSRIITIDHSDGFCSNDESKLFFFIDGVFFLKTKDSIFIEAGYSLIERIKRLFLLIKSKINNLDNLTPTSN